MPPRTLRRRIRVNAALWGVLVSALLTGLRAAGPDPDEVGPPRDPVAARVVHVRVAGDLDNMRIGRDVAAALSEASDEGAGLVVLEFDGDRWRADVIWTIGAAIRACDAEVAVWLRDPRGESVGVGPACVGLMASSCWVDPRTAIRSVASDDRRDLAPEETDWTRIDRENQGDLWVGLRERGGEPSLASDLLSPDKPVWAVRRPGGRGEEPAADVERTDPGPLIGDAAEQIVSPGAAPGSARVSISPELAVALSLARGEPRSIGLIARAHGIRPAPIVHRSIESGLAAAGDEARKRIDQIDEAIELIDDVIDEAEDLDEYSDGRDRLRSRALSLIDEAGGHLVRLESLTADYPELLRGPAPGQTPVGQTEYGYRSYWRRMFQHRRDDLTDLRLKALRLR